MKKRILWMIFLACLVMVSACESSTDSENKEVLGLNQEEYELASQYFNLEEYAKDDNRIDNPTTEKNLFSMVVDDTEFKIGMKYDDIISLGYESEDESFSEKCPGEVTVLDNFLNNKGSAISLGFISSENSDTDTVKDGSVLYEISADLKNNEFSIHGITSNSTISDITDVFGNPYDIFSGYSSDIPDFSLQYKQKDYSQYLTFHIDLKTGKIINVSLEGYTE